MYVSLPFTLDFVLEAAKDSYKDFSSFKLIPYTKDTIRKVLAQPEALSDLQRAVWRFKNEDSERKNGLGKDYVRTMQNNAAKQGIKLNDEEIRGLLAFGISTGGEHWQTGTFGMSWVFLNLLFQAQGFTIMPNQALHLRDKKIKEPGQEAEYSISYEINADIIADAKEEFINPTSTNLVKQIATFVVTEKENIYNIEINNTTNTLEVEKNFFENKLLPRVKEKFAARLKENRLLNVKDFFDYMPYLIDDDFAKIFLRQISKMIMPDFLVALHYLELCFKHNNQRRQEIFDLVFHLLGAQPDLSIFKFEMARTELKHVLRSGTGDEAQKAAASIVLKQINKLPVADLHDNLNLYTHILHDTATLIRNPSDMEAFLEYEAIIQTVNRDYNGRLLRGAMLTLLGVAVITLSAAIITAALAMPTIVIATGLILSAEFVIKSCILIGSFGGCGAVGIGLYGHLDQHETGRHYHQIKRCFLEPHTHHG